MPGQYLTTTEHMVLEGMDNVRYTNMQIIPAIH
jgi:hypothetical protein